MSNGIPLSPERYRASLATDVARLRTVAEGALDAPVPTCPGWSVADLVRHVAEVYLHKVECMRLGHAPDPWPPDTAAEPVLPLLDRAYAALTAEFDARAPGDTAYTWYPPDQTVAFWLRRMAQETAVHRVDAELATGAPSAVPDDVAVDGVDEFLTEFFAWELTTYADDEDAAPLLAAVDGVSFTVRAGDLDMVATVGTGGVRLGDTAPEGALTITGSPCAVLLWLWQRGGDNTVGITGDASTLPTLRRLLTEVAQ